jgi:hypothetical protein
LYCYKHWTVVDISTSSKGKASVSTNGVEAYSKEQLAEEIRRFTTANAQLVNDKLGIEAINAKLEADKNRLINEKNILVAKREELQTEFAAVKTILTTTSTIANTSRDKLKAKRLPLFDGAKKNLQLFFTRIRYYQRFY